jgi:hypothetical protein
MKMLNCINNMGPPPHYWDQEKIERYRDEAIEIHRALHGQAIS